MTDVRASDAFACLATEEVGVVIAPDEATCVLVDGVIDGDTYVFTIDLTGGCANGVLTITRK